MALPPVHTHIHTAQPTQPPGGQQLIELTS